jgi:predicted nucleic acid-binding Zn ribbon protein
VVCGRSISAGEGFCSTACAEALEAQRRRQRRTSFIFLGFLALLMIVWLFVFSRSIG